MWGVDEVGVGGVDEVGVECGGLGARYVLQLA